ncbi:MAG TPA: protein kinase [Chthoniobacterales bacterium]
MDFYGLTDSPVTLVGSANECPECHGVSRVANGSCIGCLLYTGMKEGEEVTADELGSALQLLPLTDYRWRLGNYEIMEEIGRGGMGVIYRARQRHSRRIVALKRILSHYADSRDTLIRFRREAEAAASLDHPNVLPIYEVGESDEGVPYFSMKFAPGGSLQVVGPALRGKPREIVRLMAKVTRAVQYAHEHGILHRDLKPGNILLDAQDEPLVSDFGLAKWLDASSDLTRTLTVFGTPGYIAPEQAEGPAANLTAAADIYSLGAILFDLLASRPPFLGDNAISVVRQAAENPAPRLRSLVTWADRDLETICARCLERDPASRYSSAGALADDFEHWLDNRPIVARPVSPPVRLWRWSRRNRALTAAGLGCILLAITAVLWQVHGNRLETSLRANQLASRSVTVLPFLNLDTVHADEATTLAVARTLQTNLSRLGPARVSPQIEGASRWPDTGYLEDISKENHNLKSRTVLTGSTRLVNGKLHLSVRLMTAGNGEIIFARSFQSNPRPNAIPALVASITSPISSLLNATDWPSISRTEKDPGLKDPAARDLIVSGRQLMFRDTIQDYDRSISCLEKAIDLEPNSALAHAYLSSTEASRAHFSPDPEILKKAEKEAETALRLDPDSREVLRTLAGVLYLRGRLKEALEGQLRAIEVGGPEEQVAGFRGMVLLRAGRPTEALPWLEMASHWASSPGAYESLIGDCWSFLVEDQRAQAAYMQAMNLRPERFDGWVGLCHLKLLQGDMGGARQLYAKYSPRTVGANLPGNDNSPQELLAQIEFFSRNYDTALELYTQLARDEPRGGVSSYGAMSYSSALGRLRQVTGDRAADLFLKEELTRATEFFQGSENPADAYVLAALEASLGQANRALDYLQLAVSLGWLDYRSLQLDPRFDTIAREPRFREIISVLINKVTGLKRSAGQSANLATNGD